MQMEDDRLCKVQIFIDLVKGFRLIYFWGFLLPQVTSRSLQCSCLTRIALSCPKGLLLHLPCRSYHTSIPLQTRKHEEHVRISHARFSF